jgi:hypothetical protein
MSTSDTLAIIALLISFFSFAVSLITLYFQFLRKTHTLKITLLDWYLENVPNTEPILLLNLAFVNLGNQATVISKIDLIFERNKENRVHVI